MIRQARKICSHFMKNGSWFSNHFLKVNSSCVYHQNSYLIAFCCDFLVAMYGYLPEVLLFLFCFVWFLPQSWDLKPKLEIFLNCPADPRLKHSLCELADRTDNPTFSTSRECDHSCVGYKEKYLWNVYEKKLLNDHKSCTRGWTKSQACPILKNSVSSPKDSLTYMHTC